MTNRTFEQDLAGLYSDKSDLKTPATLRLRVAAVPDENVRTGIVPRLALAASRTTRIAAVVVVLLPAAGFAWLRFGTGSQGSPGQPLPGQPLTIVNSAPGQPLPGQPLTIVNDAAPTPLPSGASYACPATLTNMSVRVVRSGTQLVVVDATTGGPVNAVWPYGFSARLVEGKAELLASDGTVVAREGDVLTSVNGHESSAGGAGGSAGAFDVTGFNGDCYTPSGVKVGSPGQPIPPVFSTGLGSQEP